MSKIQTVTAMSKIQTVDSAVKEAPKAEMQMVYFVHQGRMHSSWIIGHVDFDVQVAAGQEYTTPEEITANIIDNDMRVKQRDRLTENVCEMIKRPGRWYYLSGSRVVHFDDCYDTREAAADAYRSYLLSDA